MYINYKEVGKRIAKKRRSLGLKQAEVNEMAGLSDKYLSHIENARTIPSIDVLMKICSVLNTTPDYLLLGTLENPIFISDNTIQKVKLLSEKQQKLLSEIIEILSEQDF